MLGFVCDMMRYVVKESCGKLEFTVSIGPWADTEMDSTIEWNKVLEELGHTFFPN